MFLKVSLTPVGVHVTPLNVYSWLLLDIVLPGYWSLPRTSLRRMRSRRRGRKRSGKPVNRKRELKHASSDSERTDLLRHGASWTLWTRAWYPCAPRHDCPSQSRGMHTCCCSHNNCVELDFLSPTETWTGTGESSKPFLDSPEDFRPICRNGEYFYKTRLFWNLLAGNQAQGGILIFMCVVLKNHWRRTYWFL